MTREEAIKALTIQLKYWEQLKEKNVLTDHEGNNVIDILKMAIEALSAEPAKHGHWIERAKCEYRCDQCGKIVFADDENELNYCCSCGAKMERREP